jgi:hypothetical protein
LIPIIAVSVIEICPTNVNIYPALSPIAPIHQEPAYLKEKSPRYCRELEVAERDLRREVFVG